MKKRLWLQMIVLLILACGLLSVYTVQAANPSKAELLVNKTYKQYDITGDGKPDTITIKVYDTNKYGHGMYNGLIVYVNGKKVYNKVANGYFNDGWSGFPIAKIHTLKNGKPFLELQACGEDNDGIINGLFQYKTGKLKEIVNFATFIAGQNRFYGTHSNGRVMKIKNNSIYLDLYMVSRTTGMSNVIIKYAYKSGALKRSSNYYKYSHIRAIGLDNKTFVVNKKVPVYTSVAASKRTFTLKENQKVTVDKCYCNGKKLMIHINYKNKFGWIKAQTVNTVYKSRSFKNPAYAG